MYNFSKKERKMLRELANLAHERELKSELKNLNNEFKKWEKGDIDSFELNHKIHLFHNGPSQDLYSKYNGIDTPDIVVGWAIANDILKEEEVEENLIKKLKPLIERYK